ncbi:hypothetical protein EOD41_16080 [Mucilaginibacter limnophilus]|uniref:Peptidase M56 domain-containing protein n=1 Tax=Mucilaginibacter limnophilus TaxID=1932778 RepID=A0A3S2WWH1_9SPHI|nr:M56 family metallopeptidase [Mucilaginibacter limnophilus]RVT98315.1 hypothetical protein EOD41_16080 [Mucilaginibacter limnophilus]
METLLNNISQVLGITVIHSLWQGLLVYLLLQIVLSCAPSLSSAKKHNLGMLALLAMAGWFVVTFFNEVSHVDWLAKQALDNVAPFNFVPSPVSRVVNQPDSYQYIIKQYLPYITVVYLIGLLLNALKLCFAWRNIIQVKRSLTVVDELQQAVKTYTEQLNISKNVSVNISRMVDVPGVIGFMKPIILLPVTLSTSLSSAEVEAILLHELAHIKRNDYLFNLLQQVIGVLMFFNPFAILVNRIINTERENSCDDHVVEMTGQPLVYARALLKLEQYKPNLQLALAATGKKYVLLNRIERIMTTRKLTANVRHILAVILLFTLSLGSIAWLNPEIKNNKIVINPIAIARNLFADTVPGKKPVKKGVKKKTTTGVYKIKTEKGKTVIYSFDDDPELARLSAEVEKHGEAIEKFYESAEFKKLSEEMEKNGEAISAYYDSPEMRKLIEEQEKLSEEFDKKWSNNPEMEKLEKQLDEAGKQIDQYYDAPAFKTLEKQLEAASTRLEKSNFGSAEFNKNRAEVSRLSKEVGAYAQNPQIKAQQDKVRELGQKVRDYYQSPEFKAQQSRIRTLGDSIGKLHNNAAIKQQQQALRQLGEKMRAYRDNPQIKQQQKLLAEASAKLRAYTNSPAFKEKLKQRNVIIRSFDASDEAVADPRATPDAEAVPDVPPAPDIVAPASPVDPK